MKDNVIITQVTLKEGYELQQVKSTKEDRGAFFMIGKGSSESMNLIELAHEMSKGEFRIVKYIMDNIMYDPFEEEYNHLVNLTSEKNKLTKSQRVNYNKCLRELAKKDIVRKIDRYNYMINPDLLQPSKLAKYKKLWEDSKEKK